jgi:hypothetical protein
MNGRNGRGDWDGPVRVQGRWTVSAAALQWPVPRIALDWTSDEWSVPTSTVKECEALLLGWTAGELRAVPVADLVHPDDRDLLDDVSSAPVSSGSFVPVDLRILGRDSRYWWTRWRRRHTLDAGCALDGATYLRPDEWGCPVGTWRWYVDVEAVSWSPELLDMFGLQVGPPASQAAFLATVHADDRASVATTLRRAVDERGPFAYTFRCPAGAGLDRWFYAAGRCYVDHDGADVVVGLVKYLNAPPTGGRAAIGCG